MELKGKKVILTGAGAGIGYCLLHDLVREGAYVFAVDKNIDAIRVQDSCITPFECDLSEPQNTLKMIASARDKMGQIDILIANAAIAYYGETSLKTWDDAEILFRTNLFSPIYAAQEILRKRGTLPVGIVIVSSAIGLLPLPGYSYYAASKAALNAFFQAYRCEIPKSCHLMMVFPVSTKTRLLNREHPSLAMPWPIMSPGEVSASIVRGLKKNSRIVYPSRLFLVLHRFTTVFSVLREAYLLFQEHKFKKHIRSARTYFAQNPSISQNIPN